MKASKTTKSYRFWAGLMGFLSFLCLVGPFAYYGIEALIGGALVYEKVALVGSVFVVLIMTIVAAINKIALKSSIWILLFGVFLCLDNFLVPLVVIGITQVADELVFTPLHKHFAAKASINAEIDKRGI